jgi:AAA15 family ATPase/GTPase
MLIEATVGNLFSFGDPQTLSMVADDDITEKAHYVTEVELATAPHKLKLLRWAALLGANASGKSNFLKALSLLQLLVANSANNNAGSPLANNFLYYNGLSSDYLSFNTSTHKTKPSVISIVYAYQTHIYKFEVAFDAKQVHTEALYLLDDESEQLIYNREMLSDSLFAKDDILAVKAHSGVYSSQFACSRMFNNLNLKEYEQQHKHFLSLFYWLKQSFSSDKEIFSANPIEEAANVLIANQKDKSHLLNYIQHDGLTITDYVVKESHSILRGEDIVILQEGLDPLPLTSQSEGTIKLLHLAHHALTLQPHSVLCVDELDTHLHPALFVHFVQDVCLKRNIQLIFTCHSPYVLDEDGLDPRLDQIWRVEKDRSTLMSQLGCFSEFRGLPTDAKGKLKKFDVKYAYLEGVFGGVPRIDED